MYLGVCTQHKLLEGGSVLTLTLSRLLNTSNWLKEASHAMAIVTTNPSVSR